MGGKKSEILLEFRLKKIVKYDNMQSHDYHATDQDVECRYV
jgi:hypothetical protein